MDDDFVEELERARREWALVHGGAEIRWNAVWRQRIVEWVRTQQALVVGRKNHDGSRSERGTQVAAQLYTVVETALKHGHDPRDFLLRATTFALQNPGQALLPWNG
jgi:hypothetical protein